MKPHKFEIGHRVAIDWTTEEDEAVTDYGEIVGLTKEADHLCLPGWWYMVKFHHLPRQPEICPYIDWAHEDEIQLDRSYYGYPVIAFRSSQGCRLKGGTRRAWP
jgi:hypothetical protein